jgi:hypothetical protein
VNVDSCDLSIFNRTDAVPSGLQSLKACLKISRFNRTQKNVTALDLDPPNLKKYIYIVVTSKIMLSEARITIAKDPSNDFMVLDGRRSNQEKNRLILSDDSPSRIVH